MNTEYVLIVLGEPFSIFSEIIGKYFSKTKQQKKKIVLIGNKKLLNEQLKKLKYNLILYDITKMCLHKMNLDYRFLNSSPSDEHWELTVRFATLQRIEKIPGQY